MSYTSLNDTLQHTECFLRAARLLRAALLYRTAASRGLLNQPGSEAINWYRYLEKDYVGRSLQESCMLLPSS